MREKLPFLTKFFYGFGSLAYGIKDNAFNYFLLFVYVQVFGLAPNLAGLAILLMLVIDAISDPLIGYFSDKTQSKWGRRHPWMYASAIPVAVSFFLIWDPPENMTQMELFWFLLIVGAFIRTAITIYEIPSNALGPELSKDYVERSSLLLLSILVWLVGRLSCLEFFMDFCRIQHAYWHSRCQICCRYMDYLWSCLQSNYVYCNSRDSDWDSSTHKDLNMHLN